jgi:hypothetical protein
MPVSSRGGSDSGKKVGGYYTTIGIIRKTATSSPFRVKAADFEVNLSLQRGRLNTLSLSERRVLFLGRKQAKPRWSETFAFTMQWTEVTTSLKLISIPDHSCHCPSLSILG